jgi:hypothetical protein
LKKMSDILTRKGRQETADDMITRLKQLIRETDDPKIRKQAEKELKNAEQHRKKL